MNPPTRATAAPRMTAALGRSLLDRAVRAGDKAARRSARVATRVGHVAAFWAAHALGRAAGRLARPRPADFSIDLDELYRLEGHWALTFSRLGTIHLPPAKLRAMGAWLDTRSYLRLLRRARRTVAPTTVPVLEQADPAPAQGRYIRISDDYYGRGDDDGVAYYPYVMHPWVYAFGKYRRVGAMRRGPRPFRLFFSGVANEGYVDRFDFPIMSRPAIVECMLDTFRADACVVMGRADLAQLRRTDRPIALVVFRGDITPMAFNHYLTREKYLRLLARSEFALCPPGVFMPHSHNLIEAMAVGTIPVTNYAGFCRPELVPGRTCLAFATPDELVAAVRHALAAPADEVRAMRAAVTAYYDDELSPDGAARKLAEFLARPGPEYPLRLNREFPAARLWSQANARPS